MHSKVVVQSCNDSNEGSDQGPRASSKTAALVCAARAIGVSSELRDPMAAQLAPKWWRSRLPAFAENTRLVRFVRYALRAATFGIIDHNTVRMLLVDREIERAVAAGARQLVILGAGLDARAHRLATLKNCRVFEVDHAASQASKRERAAVLPLVAKSVHYVCTDFERDALRPALLAQGFDPGSPSVWVCEGVTPYLSPSSIEALLRSVGDSSSRSSRLIMSYLALPSDEDDAPTSSLPGALVKLLGEPPKGRLAQSDMARLLTDTGFSSAQDLGWEEWLSQVPGYKPLPNLLKERLVIAEYVAQAKPEVLVEYSPVTLRAASARDPSEQKANQRRSSVPPRPASVPPPAADASTRRISVVPAAPSAWPSSPNLPQSLSLPPQSLSIVVQGSSTLPPNHTIPPQSQVVARHKRAPHANRQLNHAGSEVKLVAEHLVAAMEAFGIRAAFGVTGGAFGIIFDRLSRSEKISVFHCQHEGSAAYAAMGRGIAAEGRELPVCFSTAGPGMTNLITGVAAAFTESVPMLVLTGNSPLSARNAGALQDAHVGGIDAMRMFESITVANACVERAEDLLPLFYQFAELSLRLRKPVHLNIPIDVSNELIAAEAPRAANTSRKPLVESDLLGLSRFLEGKRPLLYVGNGIKLSGLSEQLKQVAERHHLPVVVTCHGRGSFEEEHPCFFGSFGFASDGSGRQFLEAYEADSVLFLGTGLGEMATSGWSPLLGEPEWKVQVDLDKSKFNRSYDMDCCIENDIAMVLESLAERPSRRGELPARLRPSTGMLRLLRSAESGLVHPGLLFESLSKSLPDNAVIFAEPGNSMAWAFKYLRLRGTQQLCVPLGLASMGSALGAAIGAASLQPGRPIVCVAGDCATLMSGNELKTAAEYDLPVKVIVLNDGGHGMVQHGSRLVGLENIDVRFKTRADFIAYSRALGFPAARVDSQKEWNSYDLGPLLARGGPELVEVSIDPSAVPPLADRAKILSLARADTAKHDTPDFDTARRASA